MNPFKYKSIGGLKLFGESEFKPVYLYLTKFSLGVVVYNRYAAQHHGKLEPLIIKKYKILFNPRKVLYMDTLNGLWNEYHLCSKSEAIDLIVNYYQPL